MTEPTKGYALGRDRLHAFPLSVPPGDAGVISIEQRGSFSLSGPFDYDVVVVRDGRRELHRLTRHATRAGAEAAPGDFGIRPYAGAWWTDTLVRVEP